MLKKNGLLKKAAGIIMSAAMMISAITPGTVSVIADDTDAAGAAGSITIVHTNDIHGYYTDDSYNQAIGFARLETLVNELSPDLVLDAGDTFHGQSFATVEKGVSIAELMKSIGYNAMTPGNHDFSYGASQLKTLESTAGFPILASNIKDADGTDYFTTPYITKDIVLEDGETTVRVGVLGVIDDNFSASTASQNIAGLTFEEESAEATKIAQQLRQNENCDIVIALTHNEDLSGFVANTSGIDVVIAGHEHKLINMDYTDKDGKSVRVVEANYYFKNIGILTLSIGSDKKIVGIAEKTEDYSSSYKADEAVNSQIASIQEREKTVLNTKVGESTAAYAYSWEDIRVAEQELGHIVTAAYLQQTRADIAIENAGGIRGGIPEGDVTYGNIIGISPYGNTIVTKTITGQQLIDILETSIDIGIENDKIYTLQKEAIEKGEDPYQYSWPGNSGSYLQFGGISVTYDLDAAKGERVKSVKVGDADLDVSKTYTVATNNYIAESSDYPALAGASIDVYYGTCEEALILLASKSDFASAAAGTVFTKVSDEPAVDPKEDPIEDPGKEPVEDPQKNEEQGAPAAQPAASVTVKDSSSVRVKAVNTGDISQQETWVMILIVCGIGAAAALRCNKRHS